MKIDFQQQNGNGIENAESKQNWKCKLKIEFQMQIKTENYKCKMNNKLQMQNKKKVPNLN